MDQQDLTNQTTFAEAGTINWLASLEGFIDEGERTIYSAIADEVRDQPILDLGVGAGRTIPLLTALSTNYIAIDYLPEMVALARRKFPGIEVRVGDARDLSRFPDETFSLVMFSYAGIDAVDREGRERVLTEVSRVLKPGGIFWFSTLNKEGNGPRERPWLQYPSRLRSAHTLRAGLSATSELWQGLYNYWRLRKLIVDGEGWLIAPFFAHAYGLLTHYITLACQCEDLVRAGFQPGVKVFDFYGTPLDKSGDLHGVDFFNIAAKKIPITARSRSRPKTLSTSAA